MNRFGKVLFIVVLAVFFDGQVADCTTSTTTLYHALNLSDKDANTIKMYEDTFR